MSGTESLLSLHTLAAARGEGLHPKLLDLLRERAMLAADPRVAMLDTGGGRGFVQAGPCPAPPVSGTLPANVAVLHPQPVSRRAAGRK